MRVVCFCETKSVERLTDGKSKIHHVLAEEQAGVHVHLLDLKRTRFEGTEALAPGKHTIEYDFKYDGLGAATLAYNNTSGVGRGGTGTLKVDGKVVSTQKLERTLPLVKPLDQSFDIGLSGPAPGG